MQKIALFAMTLLLVMTGSVVNAESATTLTDTQIKLIKSNCLSAESILGRIHVSDALMRVNMGQQYESISTKLMAPLNSRISLNQLDGVDLAKTTVAFNSQLDKFRLEYKTYDQTVSDALNMQCSSRPADFYAQITLARSQRTVVHDSVNTLNDLVKQYASQFDQFEAATLKTASSN